MPIPSKLQQGGSLEYVRFWYLITEKCDPACKVWFHKCDAAV